MDKEKELLESLMQPDVLAKGVHVYLEKLLEMERDAVLRKEFGVYLSEEEMDDEDEEDDDKEDGAEDKTKPEDDEDDPEDEEDDEEEK